LLYAQNIQPKKEGLPADRARKFQEFCRRLDPAIWTPAIGTLACALPLLLLFDLRSVFYYDWFNHLWIIEYFGEYFRRHGRPPSVLSTENLVGIAMPLFYGGKFYWFAGMLSSFLGSAMAFRLIAFCSLMIQFWQVERAARFANGRRIISLTVATVVSWAIYPLTNLYNRSALTEFIAVLFLTSSVCSLFVLLLRNSRGYRSYGSAVSVGLFYAIAAATHPLTGVFGAVLIACVGVCFLFSHRKAWLAGVGLTNGLLIAGVLGPWFYVLARFSAWIPANDHSANQTMFRHTGFFPDNIDNILSLVFPAALDARTLYYGPKILATPYLDAQMNMPLVLLGSAFAYFWIRFGRGERERSDPCLQGVTAVSVLLFVLFLSVAIHPGLSRYFGGFFDILQFPYRLTTYLNLAALTLFLGASALWRNTARGRFFEDKEKIVVALALGMSSLGLVTKLLHANAVRYVDPYADLVRFAALDELPTVLDASQHWTPATERSSPALGYLPTTFYSHSQYMVRKGYVSVKPVRFKDQREVRFNPALVKDFGNPAPVAITLPGPTLVVTNVQPFPWNEIRVNGRPKSPLELVAMPVDWVAAKGRPGVLALPLEAGQYLIEYRFHPSKTWSNLQELSFGVLGLWFLVWLLVIVGARRSVSALGER
jgi:hypothetical protein